MTSIRRTSDGEEVFDLLDDYVSCYVADGFGERELLGAGLDAVLGEAALQAGATAIYGIIKAP
jgi:hypothetical protein